MKRRFGILCLVIFFVIWGGASALSKEKIAEDELACKTLLLKKCDDCHYMTRVCYDVGQKSTRKWKRIIKKMVRRGMKITKNEEVTLLSCLGEKVEETKNICDEYLNR